MKNESRSRLQAFRYAVQGLGDMLRTEQNARIHAGATIVVVAVGIAWQIERVEWLALTLAIAMVWCAEGFNTALESLCDVVSSEYHPKIARAKDIAAGAVLIAATGASVVGMLVFGRRLLFLVLS